MHYVLYPSKEAALLASGEWARNIRADWNFGPRKVQTVIAPDLVQPCDRPRLTGARLVGFTIRAEGDFARYGTSYAGTASATFAAAWEAS